MTFGKFTTLISEILLFFLPNITTTFPTFVEYYYISTSKSGVSTSTCRAENKASPLVNTGKVPPVKYGF